MKWLIEKLRESVRAHRAVLTAGAAVLLDVLNGLPLVHAVLRALGEVPLI